MAHGFGHEHSILRLGDGRVHEHAIGAQLHGHGGIGSGAHAGVDDQRHLGDAFAQDTQRGVILNPHARANRRTQRHHRRRARIDQAPRHDQIVIRIGQNDESLAHKLLGCFQQLRRVREKRLLIPDDFELHPVRESDFAAQARRSDCLFGGVASGGIGEQKIFVAIYVVKQRLFAAVGQIHTPHCYGDNFSARSLMRPAHLAETAIFSRAYNQPRMKCAAGNDH